MSRRTTQAVDRKSARKEGRGLRIFGTIRNKIVLPFLIVTLVVAMLGAFIVVRLVAGSAQDRLIKQIIETSQATSDSIVQQEEVQLDALRLVVFTVGVPDDLREHNSDLLTEKLVALAANQDLHLLIGVDTEGAVVAGIVRKAAGNYATDLFAGQDLSVLPMIEQVLAGQEDERGDKYAGLARIDEEIYLLTVAPVQDTSGAPVGAIALGTPMPDILDQTKQEVLANLTLYQADGKALETTFVLSGETTLEDLNISTEVYSEAALSGPDSTTWGGIVVNRREYQVAYIPLKVREDTLGVIGVALSTDAIESVVNDNRNSLSVQGAVVAALVVIVGYVIAQNLSGPIRRLANTAEAVGAGDLSLQSGVRTSDEIGILGETFDDMTRQLDTKTKALYIAYQEQEKEAAFLSQVITSVTDGIVVLSEDGLITHYNPAAQQLITANRDFWLETLRDLMLQMRRGERAQSQIEMADQWIEARAAPVLTATATEVGVVITLRDMTDDVLTERMRTGFITQMSHELLTPLTAVKGYADLAHAVLGEVHPQASEFIQLASRSTEDLNRMIIQMLDVTEMTRGGFTINPVPVDMEALLQRVIDEYAPLIQEKEHTLNLQVTPGETCECDGERLKWALEHLVKNACDYTMPKGTITITAGSDGDQYIVRVRDNGVGIGPRDLPRVFEQFFRGYPIADDGTVIDVRGTGLGLFIVDSVVKAHGGEVAVWSERGKGSEFTVKLPLSVDDRQAQEETSEEMVWPS